MSDPSGQRRVVIVGGGFAGLFAVRRLKRSNASVVLIDRAQHHVFQPLLYQCATGIMSEGKIAAPLRDLLRKQKNVDCVMAEVVDFDVAGRRVLARRIGGDRIEFGYDDLIVAAGVRQSYFGHPEFARWAPGMKTVSDALAIRRRVYGAFEMADTATDPEERRTYLTFALVGAGPTGVELAGQIREVATKTLRAEFRNIKPEDARVLLFDGGSAPLAMFGPKLSQKAAKHPRQAGCRAAHGLDRHPRRSGLCAGPRPRRPGDPLRRRHRVVDRRGGGAAHRQGPRRRHRRQAGQVRAHPGREEPHHPRPSRDLRPRRHDEPRQAPRGRRGGDAVRDLRREPRPAPDLRRHKGQAVPLP